MNILCIDDRFFNDGKHPFLKYGETYTASGEALNVDGEDCYVIPGLPISFCYPANENKGPYYRKSRFIPLSDLDETTFVTEEFEEKYCIPVNR